MGRRRRLVALAVLACLATVAAVARGGERAVPSAPAAVRSSPPQLAQGAPPALAEPAHAISAAGARRIGVRRARAARRAALRVLRRSRTVPGALRRAWLAGAIDATELADLRRVWWTAGRAHERLGGRRRAELGAVIDVAAGLARERRLTPSRLEPVFLTLRRNRDFWASRPLPAGGARYVFGRDPVTFQYYAGRGLQIQPLASFGRTNALANVCLHPTERYHCRPLALRRLLDRMVALGSVRGGFLAWEYLFGFGHGAPPWVSAMTQATGAQALARGRRVLGEPRYGAAARRALGAFEQPPPTGVAVATGAGSRYTMYSFDPGLRILNGELQAVIGLRDTATLLHSVRARRLYARGERVARQAVRAFDTGAWSLYSQNGRESTLGYHELLGGFLDGLCRRTAAQVYCATGRRFARYVREPPRVHLRRLRAVRARRATAIAFSLSKLSRVTVRVWDRRGLELRRDLQLTRGPHSIRWVPFLHGRHRLQIVATGPAGTRAILRRTVRAKARPRAHRRTAAKRASRTPRARAGRRAAASARTSA
ncbi:MAG: hypothetical protein QOE11_2862 [Solirubrobacteraceae bacterium]|jgi:hypothetical protein|nr:hypothetical protein [Solirubrobacteraceae bacterium]